MPRARPSPIKTSTNEAAAEERGHSCPQQRPDAPTAPEPSSAALPLHAAADRNVQAPLTPQISSRLASNLDDCSAERRSRCRPGKLTRLCSDKLTRPLQRTAEWKTANGVRVRDFGRWEEPRPRQSD